MTAFWEIIASNAVVATILAVFAMLLGRIWKNAAAVHVLWVVVLLKLFTPPLVTAGIPAIFAPRPAASGAASAERSSDAAVSDRAAPTAPLARIDPRPALADGDRWPISREHPGVPGDRESWSLSTLLAAAWVCGAVGMAVIYAIGIRRLTGDIRGAEAAPPAIRAMVAQLADRIGLRRVPEVLMTTRALPPLVWSIGFRPRVILPSELFARLGREARDAILAHELFHIRRRDHLVRLIELAATTVFWWHPVAWWASRRVRELEEHYCDGRVLELLPHPPRTYAAALVDAWEFLAERPWPPLPLRTAIDPAGSLSRRIRMLSRPGPNRLSAPSAAILAGLVALPLAVAFADDPGRRSQPAPEQRPSSTANRAVLRGRVTDEKGSPLADVRIRVAIPAADVRFIDLFTRHKVREARSDARGEYRLEFPEITGRTTISIDAMKPGYRRLSGPPMSRSEAKDVVVGPGEEAEAPLVLKPALYVSGVVVDEQGRPIPGVKIAASAVSADRASGSIGRAVSHPDGSFEFFNYPVPPLVFRGGGGKGVVQFFHPDYIGRDIDDVYALAPREREDLRIVLRTGYKVSGTVLDADGKPVHGAMIRVIRKDRTHRKAILSDANGRFALRGLSEGLTLLTARAMEIRQNLQMPMALKGDKIDLELRLKRIQLPAYLQGTDVLGMRLTDVTPALKSVYDLFDDRGVLILDPGRDSDRLGIGRLEEGYVFWKVGRKRVGSVREFVEQILAETAGQNAREYRVSVVYTLSTVQFDGTRTTNLRLTKDDRERLQALSDQLAPDTP